MIYERWRYSKYLAGLDFYQYEKNTPKNGAVDRIQIVCYPPKYGGVEVHKDTMSNSPLAISCYLSSKKNKDFYDGGFYLINKKGTKINLEDDIDTGDLSLYCPTIDHGVDCIDENSDLDTKNYDWNSGIGRWWMGLFTNDSNMKSNRNTSKSLDKFHSENLSEKTFNTVLITGGNSIVAKDLINFFKENFKVIAVYRKKFIKKKFE